MHVSRILLLCMLMLGAAANVAGQAFPSKPIRIVTTPAGSGTDFQARLVAQGISGPLGQPVIIENRPSGVIPGDTVAKAAPDGTTLLWAGSVFLIGSLLEKTPYDPVTDFSPITIAARSPSILAVNASLPVKSVKELIALAKARPGELNYGTGGTGGSTHLAMELFKSMTDTKMTRVPYSNIVIGYSDLVSGQVQLMIENGGQLAPHIKLGKVRALAVTSAQPSALFPALPTLAASGVPGYETVATYTVFAPAHTPADTIARLNQEIVRVLAMPQIKERFLGIGVEAVGSSPEELAAKMKSELARWGKIIKAAGISVN